MSRFLASFTVYPESFHSKIKPGAAEMICGSVGKGTCQLVVEREKLL